MFYAQLHTHRLFHKKFLFVGLKREIAFFTKSKKKYSKYFHKTQIQIKRCFNAVSEIEAVSCNRGKNAAFVRVETPNIAGISRSLLKALLIVVFLSALQSWARVDEREFQLFIASDLQAVSPNFFSLNFLFLIQEQLLPL